MQERFSISLLVFSFLPYCFFFKLSPPSLFSIFIASGDAGRSVSAYFPPGKWYDWYTYNFTSNGGESLTISTPLDYIPVCENLLKGGK